MAAAKTIALGLLLSAIAVGAACDDDEASIPPPGATSSSSGSSTSSSGGTNAAFPTTTNVTDFCEKTLGVVVGVLEQCCTASDKEAIDYKLTHDLAALLKPQCTLVLASSAAAGRVLYRADRGDACYTAYASTYGPDKCGNITETFADPSGTACREAFVGTSADGEECLGDHECVDGLTCVGYSDSAQGHCIAPPALGQLCGKAKGDAASVSNETVLNFGTHPQCATGAECDGSTGTCVTAKPAEPPPAERKSAGSACAGGLLSTECAGRCDAKTGQSGTCVTFCGSR